MRYHWLIDQSQLNNFFIYWDKGINNYADYHTKHHPPSHHRNVRPTYILNGHHIVSVSQDDTHLPALKPEQYLRTRMCLSPVTSTGCKTLHATTDVSLNHPLENNNDRFHGLTLGI